jgi:hypothetical protein
MESFDTSRIAHASESRCSAVESRRAQLAPRRMEETRYAATTIIDLGKPARHRERSPITTFFRLIYSSAFAPSWPSCSSRPHHICPARMGRNCRSSHCCQEHFAGGHYDGGGREKQGKRDGVGSFLEGTRCLVCFPWLPRRTGVFGEVRRDRCAEHTLPACSCDKKTERRWENRAEKKRKKTQTRGGRLVAQRPPAVVRGSPAEGGWTIAFFRVLSFVSTRVISAAAKSNARRVKPVGWALAHAVLLRIC